MNHRVSVSFVYILAILSMLFFGLSFVWTKIVFEVYAPFTVVVLRMMVSASALWGLSMLPIWRERIEKSDVRWFLLLGFLEPFCYFMGESFGLLEVSASVGALIIATIPVFTTLLAPFLDKSRVSLFAYAGMLLSFVGVVLVVFDANMNMQYSLRGVVLLFVAVASAVGYNVVMRRLANKYKPITVVKVQNTLGFVYFLPFFLGFEWHHFWSAAPTPRVLLSLGALTLFASTLAFLMYVFVLARIGMVRSNMFTNLIPVFAAVFSWTMLGEQFDTRKIAGMVIILCGVMVSQMRKSNSLSSAEAGEAL
jgi:drug/metabolite transporter (DMT)-like permease